jgi:purine-binding chemotaxis protein CheW
MTTTTQFVTLGIDEDVFAIPVETVQEILDYQPIARLPHAPAYLLGMIDVRGRAVPVVDLRGKLGLPRVEATPSTRILVLDVAIDGRALLIGLVADRVFEVTGLDGQTMEPPPEFGERWDSTCIGGVGRRGATFVVVLDVGHLFHQEEAPLLATGALAA